MKYDILAQITVWKFYFLFLPYFVNTVKIMYRGDTKYPFSYPCEIVI